MDPDSLFYNHISNEELKYKKEDEDELRRSKQLSISHRIKIIKQRGIGQNRKFKKEKFDMVSVCGFLEDLIRNPLLVFRNPPKDLDIRNIVFFVKIDNKTIGYKEEVRYNMTWAEAEAQNSEPVDLDSDHHLFFRFQFEEGFQLVWAFLQTFLGGYLLDAANPVDRAKEEYPQQLLEWPKEYSSWSEKVEQVRALFFQSDELELPTLDHYEAMRINASSCYNSIHRGGWDLEIPEVHVTAYNHFQDLIVWEKARLGGYWKSAGAAIERQSKMEIFGQFENVMGKFIELLTRADL